MAAGEESPFGQEAEVNVRVDRELCIGAGTCAVIAPAYFELDEQGLARVIKVAVDPGDEELVRQAEANCPAEAILIEP
jgi:ferredoxin